MLLTRHVSRLGAAWIFKTRAGKAIGPASSKTCRIRTRFHLRSASSCALTAGPTELQPVRAGLKAIVSSKPQTITANEFADAYNQRTGAAAVHLEQFGNRSTGDPASQIG